jgi:hypothetical protein
MARLLSQPLAGFLTRLSRAIVEAFNSRLLNSLSRCNKPAKIMPLILRCTLHNQMPLHDQAVITHPDLYLNSSLSITILHTNKIL